MPELKTYDLFISHAWKFTENSEYYRLVDLLRVAPYFNWRNYSVPEHDPLGVKDKTELKAKLENQIRPVNVFLVLMGMYYYYRDWIQYEVDVAKKYNKPIIGIKPRGQIVIPLQLSNEVWTTIGWNSDSIVTAIRTYSI